jgi:cytochrome P450
MDRMDHLDDMYLLKCSQKYGPIFKATQTLNPAVHVVGIKQGMELLRLHGGRLTRGRMRFSNFIPKGFIRYMDEKPHIYYRKLLSQVTAPEVIDGSLASIANSTRLELARFEDLGPVGTEAGLVLQEHIPGAVLRIFLKEFFGISQNSDEMDRFEALYRELDCRDILKKPDHTGKAAYEDLVDLVSGIAKRNEHPGSYLQTQMDKVPATLDDRTMIGNIVCMAYLGSYDVAGLIVWIWKYLSDWPEWQEKLSSILETGSNQAADDLAARIVLETLRMDQAEFIKRKSTEAFEFSGYRIPKNWGVQVCLRESHRDSEIFENSNHFDPDRLLRQNYGQEIFAPFGVGSTSCTARRLVCAVAETWVRELISNYTWTIMADGPRNYDGIHWTPAKNFAVCLSRRKP